MLVGENSRELTRKLASRMAELRSSLPPEVEVEIVYSRTDLVAKVLRTVRNNLLEGALLVVAVLFVFLGNLRAGLIVAAAIPLSMLFAFSGMLRFGIAGTLMSLGAIDFGLVVDSSVIMVENASRHLSGTDDGRSVREIVRDAAVEVRRPTLFGELIIAIVYLPILSLEGIEGKLFRPMALTVIFALAASMVLSMTLVPALASVVLRRGGSGAETRLTRGLKWAYRPALGLALRHKFGVLVFTGLSLAGSVFLATRLEHRQRLLKRHTRFGDRGILCTHLPHALLKASDLVRRERISAVDLTVEASKGQGVVNIDLCLGEQLMRSYYQEESQ